MKIKNISRVFFVTVLAMTLGVSSVVSAQSRNEREVRDAIRSLNTSLDNFEYDLRYQMQSTSANSSELSDVQDDIRGLKDSVQQFQENFDRKRENKSDAENLVQSARSVNDFVNNSGQNNRVADAWKGVRTQIERIAGNYGVTPSWDFDDNPQGVRDNNDMATTNTVSVGLSGTYDLDSARSEKIDDVIASTPASGSQRDELRQKLEAPGQIAIEIRGQQVTLATSVATPVTVTADGTQKTESGSNGNTLRMRATLSGQTLTVASLDGSTDYTITFSSESNGRVLKVTRRITMQDLDNTVFAESVYNKTDAVARLGIDSNGSGNTNSGGYSDNDQNGTSNSNGNYGGTPSISTPRIGQFIVPNGALVSGILENPIDTKVTQNNDRFRLTVQSPDQYRGAIIEGYVSGINRSGKVTGRSNVTFNFEKITLRDGKAYDFGGTLQSVKDANGKVVKVDTEGTAQGGNQTKESVKRGGIGAGLGALIGAIVGGGKGAVIGAVIGGGAGAGSVAVQGRDDLQLPKGSTITVVSSSPVR